MSRKSGRLRSIASWRRRPVRESQKSGPNQPIAPSSHEEDEARAEQQEQAPDAEPEQQRERGLEPDEAGDGHGGRAARIVEAMLERGAT